MVKSPDTRSEVRHFLMSRRAKLTPEDVGMPASGNRRVTGLRRTEVAVLAGVSVEYYAKLERGQIAGASSSVLDGIARALQLSDTERAHLFDLARAVDGVPLSGRPRRRSTRQAVTRSSLNWAVEAVTDGVAFVRNSQQDLLATNALGRAFYSSMIGDGGRQPNLARFQFLDPASRDFYPDWDVFAEMCVAIMRAEAGRDPDDRGLQDLVGELSTRSDVFRRLWERMMSGTHGAGTKRFHHPVVGELTLAYEELAVTAEPGLILMIYTAEPGSPSAERLRLLASWAMTHPAELPSEGEGVANTMQITRSSSDTAKGPADWFTGDVYIDAVAAAPPPSRVTANLVHFMPGARTHWHRHPLGQTVFVTEGVGLCQRRGGPVEIIRPGDRVLFEADEEHWHGATANRLMVHVAINEGDDDHAVVHWLTPVTDDEYAAAPLTGT